MIRGDISKSCDCGLEYLVILNAMPFMFPNSHQVLFFLQSYCCLVVVLQRLNWRLLTQFLLNLGLLLIMIQLQWNLIWGLPPVRTVRQRSALWNGKQPRRLTAFMVIGSMICLSHCLLKWRPDFFRCKFCYMCVHSYASLMHHWSFWLLWHGFHV